MAGFHRTQNMPSILSSGGYLLIRDKNVAFACITKIATENIVFARSGIKIFIRVQTKESCFAFQAQEKLYKMRELPQILSL